MVHRVIGGQDSSSAGKFLCIRVGLNIHQFLHRWVLFQPDLSSEVTKYCLEYENWPYFCLYCGKLMHGCSSCELFKLGQVTEKQFGRWITLIRDVFCFDPDGELKGTSFGLCPKNRGWVLKAPETSLAGNVRCRTEAFPEDVLNGGSMEVDTMAGEIVKSVTPMGKRRRINELVLENSTLIARLNCTPSNLGGQGFGADLLCKSISQLRGEYMSPKSGQEVTPNSIYTKKVSVTGGKFSNSDNEIPGALGQFSSVGLSGPEITVPICGELDPRDGDNPSTAVVKTVGDFSNPGLKNEASKADKGK